MERATVRGEFILSNVGRGTFLLVAVQDLMGDPTRNLTGSLLGARNPALLGVHGNLRGGRSRSESYIVASGPALEYYNNVKDKAPTV